MLTEAKHLFSAFSNPSLRVTIPAVLKYIFFATFAASR